MKSINTLMVLVFVLTAAPCAAQTSGVFVTNGTGGGGWLDSNTWDELGGDTSAPVPGITTSYDVVVIRAGDTVTLSSFCAADIDGTGVVGPADLAQVLGQWGPCGNEACTADINADGVVGPGDLAQVLGNWGACGDPSIMGFFLLEQGATLVFTGVPELDVLSAQLLGDIEFPFETVATAAFNEVITLHNTVEVYRNGSYHIEREYTGEFCDILELAPEPFDVYLPCSPPETASQGGVAFGVDSTHRIITDVAVDNQLCVLDQRLAFDWGYEGGIDHELFAAGIGSLTAKEWVIEGAEREDELQPSPRDFNHYLNPVDNSALFDHGYIGFDWRRADIWAINQPENVWNVRETMTALHAAFTATSTPAIRAALLAKSLRGVGQVVHVIQDMAAPAHTRSDPHFALTDATSDPFESYVAENFSDVESLDGLGVVTVPAAREYPRYILFEDVPVASELQDYWDTDQWIGQELSQLSSSAGLAEQSNFGYFSSDALFSAAPRPAVEDTDLFAVVNVTPGMNSVIVESGSLGEPTQVASPLPPEWESVSRLTGSLVDRFLAGRNLGPHPIHVHFEDLIGPAPDLIEVSMVNDDIMAEYAANLLPQSIAYSTGVINHLFRNDIDVSIELALAKHMLTVTAQPVGMSEIGPGNWQLYQDDSAGVRHKVDADFQVFIMPYGPYGPYSPHVISYVVGSAYQTQMDGPFTVVFDNLNTPYSYYGAVVIGQTIPYGDVKVSRGYMFTPPSTFTSVLIAAVVCLMSALGLYQYGSAQRRPLLEPQDPQA